MIKKKILYIRKYIKYIKDQIFDLFGSMIMNLRFVLFDVIGLVLM